MALESLFLKLETCPGCLCGAETQTVQMRPSQPKLEVVTNWRIFQKPPRNQEKSQLFVRKSVLEPKLWVQMGLETTLNYRLDLPVDMAPWRSKSESVANWRIFQKMTATLKWPFLGLLEGFRALKKLVHRGFSPYMTPPHHVLGV